MRADDIGPAIFGILVLVGLVALRWGSASRFWRDTIAPWLDRQTGHGSEDDNSTT